MKAAGSIGANSPLRLRLLVMTWETPTPTSASAGVPATKFGIAIGSGVNSPSGTMMRFCASALRPPTSRPADAIPEMICRRLGRNSMFGNPFLSVMVSTLLISVIAAR